MKYEELPFYKALLSHYVAQRDAALATLKLYFENPVGIGEHSDMLEEYKKHLELLAEAEDCIESLKRNFNGREI